MRSLNRCSKRRAVWLALALTAFALELVALCFQHIMLLKPCVLCIYQRCALYGIMASGLVGAISPATPLRFAGLIIWLYSAWKGLMLAMQYTDIQLHPSLLVTCDFCISFPTWLPLDKWMPLIFSTNGDCIVHQRRFLSMEMPRWMILIFIAYLVLAILILLSQFFPSRKRDFFSL
ncbi:Disulfide bond formation protein B [Candidatus Doolittlea endobia]|uniref:Disulfide bond formation protein B n=2 Tax=Candidatus Doolittlea endobia TaxID=1778262 RepID=A0A143WSD2_9ENTR|nr:Disulfide bond formation protein B [Candidatus Doolittlea endobia]